LLTRHQSKDLTSEDAGLDADQGDKTRIINNTIGLSLPRPRRLWGGLDLQESLSVTYLTENYDLFEMLFGDLTDFLQGQIEIALGDDRDTMRAEYQGLVLGADWIYRTMDDPMNARRGDYLRLSLKGSHSALGSNFSFAQAHLRSAMIRPIGDGRLILRGEAAYTQVETKRIEALGNVVANQMPELYEFRAGGDRSVRGYKYEELLPSNSFTGGKHLLVGSVEYEHTIIPDWSAAVFVDAGTAFNDFADIEPGIGVGVGARWRSPVGPVRLDLAVPMTDSDSAFRIHITIGPEF
jgi:translocation and assembly module TamA